MRVLSLLLLLVPAALAGEDGASRGLTGFPCENLCPLAREANDWRSTGVETLAVRSRLQADLAARVTRALGGI